MTSKAFSIIYDWMISPTNESYQLLRRDNILDVFMAAQYLGIKGAILFHILNFYFMKQNKLLLFKYKRTKHSKKIYKKCNKIHFFLLKTYTFRIFRILKN